jgi:ubiquinol-cytochrome c reductase cytochrome c1 subunit
MFRRLQQALPERKSVVWFGKALVGSTVGGIAISELVLTPERMDVLERSVHSTKLAVQKQAEKFGISFFNDAHAFSTADHGLHPAHLPWEFEKIYKTFDHDAYSKINQSPPWISSLS